MLTSRQEPHALRLVGSGQEVEFYSKSNGIWVWVLKGLFFFFFNPLSDLLYTFLAVIFGRHLWLSNWGVEEAVGHFQEASPAGGKGKFGNEVGLGKGI